MIREDITAAVKKALEKAGAPGARFAVDYPPSATGAEYATNAALSAARILKRSPREVAEILRSGLASVPIPHVENIEATAAGFLNFHLDRAYVAEIITAAARQKMQWWSNQDRAGQRIMVEYTQPNPFKPFHIGHLMSNALGESIARLCAHEGGHVIRANYQGDVGLHVAKALFAVMLKGFDPTDIRQLGEAYVLGSAAYEDDPAAQAEIVQINKKIYERDPAIYPRYLVGREASLKHFELLYAILGTTFDEYFFESEVWPAGVALVEEGIAQHIFEISDGAVVFRGDSAGLHTRVFLTREGLPTYEAKDLGLALAKMDRHPFDRSITVTAVEQNEYFKVVFEALGRLRPETRGIFSHLSHGLMLLASGKMSSRKGNVVTGESLIENMIAASRKRMRGRDLDSQHRERIARQVAVAAIKYSILRQASGKNIVFDPERSLSLDGDSGPYLQYAHTRCASILKKAQQEGISRKEAAEGDFSPPARLLVRLTARFPEIVARAAETYEPHHVTHYLTELAGAFNAWYASERVLDGTPGESDRLFLVDAVRQTLRNGLWLLGIEAPEEM